jgi:hypothetical protein
VLWLMELPLRSFLAKLRVLFPFSSLLSSPSLYDFIISSRSSILIINSVNFCLIREGRRVSEDVSGSYQCACLS